MDCFNLILKSWVDAALLDANNPLQSCLQRFLAVISDPSDNLEPLSVIVSPLFAAGVELPFPS